MPRKKRQNTQPTPEDFVQNNPSSEAAAEGAAVQTGEASRSLPFSRSFKATLTVADKGVSLGARDGHDWVVSFPGDPGTDVKDRLKAVGFAYSDRKWKIFTNAGNRQPVETLIKELKRQLGEEIDVREYTSKQVVLAFDGFPGEEVINQLKDNAFFYRSDRTWNADSTPENRKLAHDLIKSLPPIERSAEASR